MTAFVSRQRQHVISSNVGDEADENASIVAEVLVAVVVYLVNRLIGLKAVPESPTARQKGVS